MNDDFVGSHLYHGEYTLASIEASVFYDPPSMGLIVRSEAIVSLREPGSIVCLAIQDSGIPSRPYSTRRIIKIR